MQTEEKVTESREKLFAKLASLDDESVDAEIAKNLIHTLTWVLDPAGTSIPPDDLLGFTRARFTSEAFEVVRFKKQEG
jgi:hypothetical protein